ncbi:type II toxin-antitoxin system RelE/ParE family toxin [Desulfovibrio sp. OttesenSCG-928-F20]|nr:type II toxin-antitoxin system RelE/ParE family toxin [Desulfovibrio sp. OttesenSCG-928-F20]
MSYALEFHPLALKEWAKLGSTTREQFKKKLAERLEHPRVESDALRGMQDVYKIKLRSLGYRLVYRVDDGRVVVVVIAIGKRDKNYVYTKAADRE